MNSRTPPLHRAVQSARWFAELTTALDQASKLTLMLCAYCNGSSEATVLRAQILELGSEVDLIQRRRQPVSGEFDPNWMK